MARDVMYYFDKKSPYARHELGEIQTDFNMGLTIDGSKDSMQVQVFNYEKAEITPNTILFHNATNTWWIVKKDNVKRYASENGFYYQHNLSLLGAIDLLSSRDLTDCGFNDRTYTIDQFIKRLFKLSTFEFLLTINYGNNVDENKIVDYIKSFENYTLLSALRDFLNGYNCDAKLTFATSGSDNHIESANLIIIPRTGNVDLTAVDISDFDDVREQKSYSKESYGTTVISNAQNVVSTQAKTYPQIGGVRLSADTYNITTSNAVLRLPTPIYKVNWVKLLHYVDVIFYVYRGQESYDSHEYTFRFYPWNKYQTQKTFDEAIETVVNFLTTQYTQVTPQEVSEYVESFRQTIIDVVEKASCTTIKGGWGIKPVMVDNTPDQELIAPQNDPDFRFRNIVKRDGSVAIYFSRSLLIGSKEDYESVVWKTRCMYYERGGNEIHNFSWMGVLGGNVYEATTIGNYKTTDYNSTQRTLMPTHTFSDNQRKMSVYLVPADNGTGTISNANNYVFNIGNTYFQVNYIPMSDIKIKYDNSLNDIDTHIYNQNGKLNDSVALSKLLDSYSKEIQSDNITRYMHYTNISDIPQVGSLVNSGNEKYVINNISYDFFVNETNNDNNVGYYIECEFTLSKYISVKSLMVNPNSNIRDYGIPQKYNIKRRQVYRDYFEFSFLEESSANQETPYVSLSKYLTMGTTNEQKEYDHTAIMKIDYEQPVDNQESWYYQLNSVASVMNKSLYEVIDFNDNNIIGYDIQNYHSGFNMNKLFSNGWKTTNVPISYVDNDGKFKGITLQFVGKDKIEELYENISADTNNSTMFSSHVFVGETFYYGKYIDGQESEEPNSFSSNNLGNYLSTDSGNTIIKIPLTELNYDNSGVDLDTVVIDIVGNITYVPRTGPTQSGIVGSYSIITENDIKYLRIVDTSGTQFPLLYSSFVVSYEVSYSYRTYAYRGAIDLKDYEIEELNYEKDAIEVPVFEYILQLGDTEQVEVGDRILDTQSGMLQMFTCDVRQANTTTQLNASKVFSGIDVSGDSLVNDNYDRQIEIADTSAVDISFENNNTIMRIKVYDNQVALFYGTAEQDFTYQDTQVSATQLPKSYLLGKDIVIYKNVIKSMSYDMEQDEATCDYDNELMFIIHNPQDSNFDGDDLLINVNYYKLK